MSSFEMSWTAYTVFIALPVVLITLVLWYLVRGAVARRVVFACFAVASASIVVLAVLWALRSWPAWFMAVPATVGLGWSLREMYRQAFRSSRANY
jgi:hypothetical protein